MAKSQGGAHVSVSKLNNVLMQMRKNCNHPDLIKGAFDGSITYPSSEEIRAQCGKMQLLERMLRSLHKGGHKVLIFSQVQPHCSMRVNAPLLLLLPQQRKSQKLRRWLIVFAFLKVNSKLEIFRVLCLQARRQRLTVEILHQGFRGVAACIEQGVGLCDFLYVTGVTLVVKAVHTCMCDGNSLTLSLSLVPGLLMLTQPVQSLLACPVHPFLFLSTHQQSTTYEPKLNCLRLHALSYSQMPTCLDQGLSAQVRRSFIHT